MASAEQSSMTPRRRGLVIGIGFIVLLAALVVGWQWLAMQAPRPPRDRLANMVLVAGGPFLYGVEKRQVDLPAFYIDRYEVSQADYARFLEDMRHARDHSLCNRSEPPVKLETAHTPLGWGLPHLSDPRFPVVGLDYWDAYAYARWVGKRLPTEQEWEKAARGVDGRAHPWGDQWDPERCNWGPGGGYNRTLLPVDSMPDGQSPYGCYHMLGNAAEWTDSFYDESVGLRAGRGFCWRLGHMVPFVVTYRMQGSPSLRDEGSGLRCALDGHRN